MLYGMAVWLPEKYAAVHMYYELTLICGKNKVNELSVSWRPSAIKLFFPVQ